MSGKQKQPEVGLYNVIYNISQWDLGLVRSLTMTSLQIYRVVYFERIF